MTPRIGITTSLATEGDETRQSLDHAYVDAVERAGGVPLLLPTTCSYSTMRAAVDGIDGLIIPGGPGITEGLVGDLPEDLPPVHAPRWTSDGMALEAALVLRLPILGICYGMQLINVRHGGTLFADTQAQAGSGPHSPKRNCGSTPLHDIAIEPRSHLARVLGGASSARVNSRHLQAVKDVGHGLMVSARSPDGVIEALESVNGRILGVQFHPECMPGPPWSALFDHFVRTAAERGGPG